MGRIRGGGKTRYAVWKGEHCIAIGTAALLAFLVWFVFYLPAPDYMPGYGSDPRQIPYQMKD